MSVLQSRRRIAETASAERRPARRKGKLTLSVVWGTNGFGVGAAAGFAAAGLARPNFSEPSASAESLVRFWSASSAVRTWALTLGFLTAMGRKQRPSSELLAVAGFVQLGDAALGIWQRNPRMAILPAVMGAVHLWSASLAAPRRGHDAGRARLFRQRA